MRWPPLLPPPRKSNSGKSVSFINKAPSQGLYLLEGADRDACPLIKTSILYLYQKSLLRVKPIVWTVAVPVELPIKNPVVGGLVKGDTRLEVLFWVIE